MDNINWLSMVLACVTPLAIGSLYYHQAVFGAALTASRGSLAEHGKERSRGGVISVFLVISFLLSFFLLNFNNSGINQEGNFDTFQHGAWHGLFVAVTVIIPVVVIMGLQEQKAA